MPLVADLPPGPAARVFCADITKYSRLIEERLAVVHRVRVALLFGSGYAANIGLLQAVVSPDDLIVSDERNHASLIDGIRLTKAATAIYPHQDLQGARDGARTIPDGTRVRHHRERVQHGWRPDAASRGVRHRRAGGRRGDCRRGTRHGNVRSARIRASRRARPARPCRCDDSYRRKGAWIRRRLGGGIARAARCDGEPSALLHFFHCAAAGPWCGARCGAGSRGARAGAAPRGAPEVVAVERRTSRCWRAARSASR